MPMQYQGASKPPVLLIHGGVNLNGPGDILTPETGAVLDEIASNTWAELCRGCSAIEATAIAVEQLENVPMFNAGIGSTLQSDGAARLTASIMDSEKQMFSAVNLATNMINPSKLATALQGRKDRVLGPLGTQLLARELGMPISNPLTTKQLKRLIKFIEEDGVATGTVGAVALDKNGKLSACTSTGGTSYEFPDRMSDVGSVAGNYASPFAAISCSGIGEQIMDDGVSVRLETRVRDGKNISEASDIAYEEAEARQHRYGWIAVDHDGNWNAYYTTKVMALGFMSAEHQTPFIPTRDDPEVYNLSSS